MKKITDEQLLLDIIKIYTNSESKKDFNAELKQYIKDNKINKTTQYLKLLLDEYKSNLNSETLEYEIIERTKEIHREMSSYKTVIEELAKMTDEQLIEYIHNNDLAALKLKFEKYLQKTTDTKLLKTAKETLERILKLKSQTKQQKIDNLTKEKYELAIKVYETMASRGYFNYKQFAREQHDFFNCGVLKMEQLITYSRMFLYSNYPEKLKEYRKKIQNNKIKYYIYNTKKFKHMITNIPENYDIINYYIDFKTPLIEFIDYYKDLGQLKVLKSEQIVKLNKFFSQYIDKMSNTINEKSVDINDHIQYGEKIISQEEKEKVLEFMEKYKIPSNFFLRCYVKYTKGELDKYIKQKQK